MESAKGSFMYKFDRFDVSITPYSDKKLAITVTDPLDKIEFHEKMLTLTSVGTATLMKALERKLLQVKMDMRVNRTPEGPVLQIDVLVASQFLRPVEETIFVAKSRDISESEVLRTAVESLSSKIKALKEKDDAGPNKIIKGSVAPQEKSYTGGNNYQSIGSIRLPKGKHVITLSFLLKATNQWIYIYFNQGQQFIQNCGFYLPNATSFFPYTIRKLHTVTANEEVVNFNTYCTQSYPVTLKNVIVTSQVLE